MKEADFTLIPYGGLGNRINAICSAIVYTQNTNKSLRIIWFRDEGLNCLSKDLFSVSPQIRNVTIKEASFTDYILRDRPRIKNLWIPKLFQSLLYDRRIYEKEASKVFSKKEKNDFGLLDNYNHILMISYSRLWTNSQMWNYLVPNPEIIAKADKITANFGDKTIGLHIRRSDNIVATNLSPTNLFVEKIEKEINKNPDTCFYLVSDSLQEKEKLKSLFGDKIITSLKKTSRNTKDGIIEAYVEIVALSRTQKIYGSAQSSFCELAHLLSRNEFEVLKNK